MVLIVPVPDHCLTFTLQYMYNKHISVFTVKFLNFGTPEIFAVINIKFKQRGQTLKGILSKWCKWNGKQ